MAFLPGLVKAPAVWRRTKNPPTALALEEKEAYDEGQVNKGESVLPG